MVVLSQILSVFLLAGLLFGRNVHCQEVIETTVTLAAPPGSKQEAVEKAIEEVTQRYTKELLGETKFNRSRELIKNKIQRQSNKFILFFKTSPLGDKPDQTIQIKLSLKSLEQLLFSEGLLYRTEGLPRVVAFIDFVDKVNGSSLSWWVSAEREEKYFLFDLSGTVFSLLRESLRKRGFFLLEPLLAKTSLVVPDPFKTEILSIEDAMALSDYLKGSLVIRGGVAVTASLVRPSAFKLDIRLSAIHGANGRVIGDVIRSYETEAGAMQVTVLKKAREVIGKAGDDLGGQLFEAWRSGSFGANVYQMAIRGALDYQSLTQLKKLILTDVREIKQLKERRFEAGLAVYEVDTALSVVQIADLLRGKSWPRFSVQVEDVKKEGLALKVKLN